jgi:ABC-type branched-subunit amino acid transport system permease subunit
MSPTVEERPAQVAKRDWLPWIGRSATFVVLAYMVSTGLTAQPYGLDIFATAMVFALYTTGVDLSWGSGGVLMLGSALFFGIGAYGMALALTHGVDPVLAYPAVILAAVLLGLLIAFVGFRSRAAQIQFGLIGLAVALAFQRLSVSLYDLTGGSDGLNGVTRPVLAGVIDLTDPRSYYFFVLAVVAAIVTLLRLLKRSAWGDAVRAIRDDPERASSLGYRVDVMRYQVVAVSAAVIATAGTLFPSLSGTAYPELFGITLNMQALVWVAIGGAGTLFGPLILAFVLKVVESDLAGVSADYYLLVIGVAFIVAVIAAPQGIGGLVRDGLHGLLGLRRRKNRHADNSQSNGPARSGKSWRDGRGDGS